MQKLHRNDDDKTYILWGLGYDGNLKLTFTKEELRKAGYFYDPINIFDLQSVFQCNVTIEKKNTQTIFYNEREERFQKPIKDS